MSPEAEQALPPLRPTLLPQALPRLEKEGRLLQRIMILLPVGVLVSLAYSASRTDFSELPDLLTVQPLYLALAVLLALLPFLTNTLRLAGWLRFLGRPLTLADTFRITLAGELGAAVSPTALGSGPVKLAMLNRRGFNLGTSASLLGLASIEDMVFTILAIPLALGISGAWRLLLLESLRLDRFSTHWLQGIALALVVLSVLGTIGWRRSGRPGLAARMGRFRTDVRDIASLVGRRGTGVLAVNTLLASIQWSARYSVASALLWGLGIEADPLRLAAIQWMCFTAMTLTPTPGAAGGAEATFLVFYSGLIPPEIIALAMFFWRFLTYYLLSGLALVLYLKLGPGPGPDS